MIRINLRITLYLKYIKQIILNEKRYALHNNPININEKRKINLTDNIICLIVLYIIL